MRRKFKGNGFHAAEALYGPSKPGPTQLRMNLTDPKENTLDPVASSPIFEKTEPNAIYIDPSKKPIDLQAMG